ncbi:MAG: hypothetical protein ABSE05_01865 [Syntrophales bacterium]|jgi:hypothetical protein
MDNLNADAGANFSGKIFDHCEKIYCLSFNEEFDESVADYFDIGRWGSYHPNSFLSTFFCDYSAIFSMNVISGCL